MTKLTQFILLLLRRPSRQTKKGLIYLALLLGVFWPIPTVRRKASDVVTIRNHGHLYILISVTVIGGITTPLGTLIKWPYEHTLTEDLIFYHIYNGQSTRYLLNDVLFGSPQAYQGTLLFRGVARKGQGYDKLLYQRSGRVQYFRWTGAGFLPVAELENTQISTAIETRPDDGLTVPNGWLKVDYIQIAGTAPPGLPTHRVPLVVKDHAYVLVLRRQDVNAIPHTSVASYWEEYSLYGLNPSVDHLLLYHWDNTVRITSWKTYASL